MKEIHSFSLVDYACQRKGADERLCHAALFLIVGWLLQSTLYYSINFDKYAYVNRVENQIARGDTVRKSGLLPAFTRVSYMDPNPHEAFNRFCQIQCGLAPIFLLQDQWHEHLLLNASQRPSRLPEGYRLMRDFGHGLLLLRKV
ncbi:MAG: hypothetical protein P4L53_13275 [Candidatus Obscuribacterales bacterium]|nr:hypothetical protein [Candidatus Obscuribacterales bacterium]